MLGRIDGIIFPELALVPEEFEALRDAEFTQRTFLVGGIARGPQACFVKTLTRRDVASEPLF
jgi:hypothetical protein